MRALSAVARVEARRQVARAATYAVLVNLPFLNALLRLGTGRTTRDAAAFYYQQLHLDITSTVFAHFAGLLFALVAGLDLFAREWGEGHGVLYRTLPARTGTTALVRVAVAVIALAAGILSHVVVRCVLAPWRLGVPVELVPSLRMAGTLALYLLPFLLLGMLSGLYLRVAPGLVLFVLAWALLPNWGGPDEPLWIVFNGGAVLEGKLPASGVVTPWFVVGSWLAATAVVALLIFRRAERREIA